MQIVVRLLREYCSAVWSLVYLYLMADLTSLACPPTTASDQWSEFTFSPEATFIQLKVEVLRHWHILPERLPLTSNSSSQTQASDNLPHSGTRAEWTAKETRIHRQPSHSSTLSKEQGLDASKGERRRVSLLSSSGSGMLGESTQYQPQSESLRECARILAKHAFRSVCNGCFLPDDEVLAKHCVEYDLLIVSFHAFPDELGP